ncbi:MAG: hypothetical protein HYR96_06775 [Deltaproteobacteria bacterium]|nr:hypothetical protein [Deltaproteobacteria bacterium]MBI3296434.1 hypothetical protein [Deltaproteobacteria bacterium]
MLSLCPKCHHEIEHEDYLFEVTCSCGAHFNPFMTTQDSQSPMSHQASELVLAAKTINVPEPTNNTERFSESEAAFSAIREFGEGLSTNGKLKTPEPSAAALSMGPSSAIISVRSELATRGEPLAPVMKALNDLAMQRGASVTLVQWQILNDSRTVIASATLAKAEKRS